MTKEQAYAAIGRMAVEYARELRGSDFCPRDDIDDCTIKILGMADMLDQMEEAGAFGAEATEHELCDSGRIRSTAGTRCGCPAWTRKRRSRQMVCENCGIVRR